MSTSDILRPSGKSKIPRITGIPSTVFLASILIVQIEVAKAISGIPSIRTSLRSGFPVPEARTNTIRRTEILSTTTILTVNALTFFQITLSSTSLMSFRTTNANT